MFSPQGELPHTPQTAHTLQRALSAVSLTTRMGCNLCTLQKREEHYKLLYDIAQVSETEGRRCTAGIVSEMSLTARRKGPEDGSDDVDD